MTELAGAAFDRIAPYYDDLWSRSGTGRLQREAVWRYTDLLFAAGDHNPGKHILDLGCGTGEDAVHFMSRGVSVSAIDASPAMTDVARRRGVPAVTLSLEQLDRLDGTFDGALSNFGALNCVENLRVLRDPLSRLIRPGGYLACCVLGRFCLWESLYYLARGELRKCARRWSGGAEWHRLGVRVFYPRVRSIFRAFAPDFEQIDLIGIGIFVPPSFVAGLPPAVLTHCGAFDRKLAHRRGVRALADHRLLIFRRR